MAEFPDVLRSSLSIICWERYKACWHKWNAWPKNGLVKPFFGLLKKTEKYFKKSF